MKVKSMCSRRQLLLALSGSALSAANAGSAITKTDLFEAGKEGYELYRIPGVVVTHKGTVLAFCEARKSSKGDWGTTDILLRRSTDNGRTWSPRQSIAQVPGSHRKNPVAIAQNLATPDEITYNNPTAVADRDGSVHFLFCLEYMRAFYMRSSDEGRTFSQPVEITAAFEGFRPQYDWKVLATGPGTVFSCAKPAAGAGMAFHRDGRARAPAFGELGHLQRRPR